ncbi:MAG: FkbM family methyltransferase [Pseudomonadota bacterium]
MSTYDIFTSPPIQIVRSSILGETVLFSVDQPKDLIQSHHLKGQFYEPDELMIMSRVFPIGGRLLDIGANIGNHSVFFGKIMKASYIKPIEVNPRVISLLRSNLIINGLEEVCDTSHLGLGLYDEVKENVSIKFWENNIGGGKIKMADGELNLVRGDDILTEPADLVKIDVEGAEIKVLNGMASYIDAHRPNMFIEVDNENSDAFTAWVADNKYRVLETFSRYDVNVNYLITAQ